MSTPQQRVHEATRSLLDLLDGGEPLSARAVELRAELAVATAEAGHVEDAFYQVDELLKDTRRAHGAADAQHPSITRARAAVASVEEIARRG